MIAKHEWVETEERMAAERSTKGGGVKRLSLDEVCDLQRQGYTVRFRYKESDRQTIIRFIDHCASMAEDYRQKNKKEEERFSRGYNAGFEQAWGLAAATLAENIGIASCAASYRREENLAHFRRCQAKINGVAVEEVAA